MYFNYKLILQFTPEKRERFMNITALTINNYCASNKCEDVSRKKRDAKDSLSKRYLCDIIYYTVHIAIGNHIQ